MQALRILIVDDEAGMRHSIARALKNYTVRLSDIEGEVRFETESAASGEEALTRMETKLPDIVLLDHQLGGITGLDVLGRLAAQQRDVLTIMITAFATIETAVRATKNGAFDFIAKPFTPDELKETIRKTASHLMVQREARRLAAEKRRVRFEFISVLAHELKSPLGVVETYLGMIKNRISGNELTAYDELITRSLGRLEGMRKLISDLLDLTRIESGERLRDLGAVDVVSIARAAIEAANADAAERQIAIRLIAEGPLAMTADRGELEIILNNLVSNAVKYNRPSGTVDVTLTADADHVRIEVADTGIGFTAEELGRLFSEFVRIRNEKTHSIPGSGLGLSTVRKIAELYHGSVTARGQTDVGSTFTVVLERNTPLPEPKDGPQRNPEMVA